MTRNLYWIEFTHVGVSHTCPQLGKVEKTGSDFMPGTSQEDATNNLLIRFRNHPTINVHTIAIRRIEEVTYENCEKFDLDPASLELERDQPGDVL